MMTTENNKTKLNLRPSIGDKQQSPPTKLLINHGKPNYTINRSAVKSNQRLINSNNTTLSTKNEQVNGFVNFTLKKPQTTTTIKATHLKLPSKKSNESNNEFLQKRKQIYDKIERENSIEENGYTNKIEHGSITTTTTSPKEQNYVKKMSERLQNETLLKSKSFTSPKPQNLLMPPVQNGQILESTKVNGVVENCTNGHDEDVVVIEKPALPKKNFILNGSNTPPSSPPLPPPPPPPSSLSSFIIQNRNSPSRFVNGNDAMTTTTNFPKIPTSPNGNTNFEQKPFVSFSKDLASEPNKYPDIVKVVKPAASTNNVESNDTLSGKEKEVLQELTKLKFDIDVKEDVIIKPVIRSDF